MSLPIRAWAPGLRRLALLWHVQTVRKRRSYLKNKRVAAAAAVSRTADTAAQPSRGKASSAVHPVSGFPLVSCLSGTRGAAASTPGAKKRVSFCDVVDVREYARKLGGSQGIPSTGGMVSLGLGKFCSETTRVLDVTKRGKALEELVLPQWKRVKLLVGNAGVDSISEREWQQECDDVARVQRERQQSVTMDVTNPPEPANVRQALTRARTLALSLQT